MAGQNLNYTLMASQAASAAGNTSIVAAVTGEVFTVVGYEVQATSNVASAAPVVITVDLRDGATTSLKAQRIFFAPSTSVTTGGPNPLTSGWMTPPYASMRTTAGNALNINLSAALTAGTVQVTVAYIQEPA